MRTTALVLGIIGGVFGILAGLFALTVGGAAAGLEAKGGGEVAGLGFVAVLLGVMGVVGGAVANNHPRAAAALQLIAGIGGFIAVSLFWVLAGILLILGGIFGFAGREKGVEPPAREAE